MTGFDLTPLYRSTVGFDRLANIFDALGAAPEKTASYPPYNVERTGERDYRITMAVAGFSEDELDIEECCGVLTVRGVHQGDSETQERNYLYRGIANRSFERRFQLAENVQVSNAGIDNGLLSIDLTREIPEAEKPRKIDIAKTLKAA